MLQTAVQETQMTPAAIDFQGVSKTYGGASGHVAVENVDLCIAPGEFVSLVGPSGCGKTTLLNMAAGFVVPDTGSVLASGSPVTGPHRSRGMVFQQYAIFPWLTVRKNIEFGLKLRCNRTPKAEVRPVVDHYLDAMDLTKFADSLPKTLSGGMKQRVAIARAYAARPDVLLMDEPFAALDAQTREAMQGILQQIQREERRSVLFVTHSVEEAIVLSHRIVVLGQSSRILDDLTIDLDKDRGHELRLSPEFIELRRHVEHMLTVAMSQR